jgi:hypothetical protein
MPPRRHLRRLHPRRPLHLHAPSAAWRPPTAGSASTEELGALPPWGSPSRMKASGGRRPAHGGESSAGERSQCSAPRAKHAAARGKAEAVAVQWAGGGGGGTLARRRRRLGRGGRLGFPTLTAPFLPIYRGQPRLDRLGPLAGRPRPGSRVELRQAGTHCRPSRAAASRREMQAEPRPHSLLCNFKNMPPLFLSIYML